MLGQLRSRLVGASVALGAPFVAIDAQAAQNVSQFRGGAEHHGVFGAAVGESYAGLAWRFETSGPVRSSPIVYEDLVFVGSADGNVYAIDRQSGRERWRAALRSAVNSTPAARAGIVYAATMGGTFAALSARDGRVLWSHRFGGDARLAWGRESGDVYVSSPTIAGDVVVVGAGDGNVYAFDAATGTMRWQFHTDGRVRSTPAVSNATVYAASFDGSVYAIDLASGKQRWRFDTEGRALESAKFGYDRRSIQSSPSVFDGVVYVGSRDGHLYAIDAATGKERWTYAHDATSWSIASPAVRENVVYDASSDALFIHALDRTNGRELWRTKTNAAVWSSSAIAGNSLFVGDGGGLVHALDARTGAERWSFQTRGNVQSSPAVSDGIVYIGSADGAVYALRTGSAPLQRAVYWDSTMMSRSRFDRRDVRAFLVARGYTLLDAAGLARFVTARAGDHAPSVVVFALDQLSAEGLGVLRRYLDAGGTAVWLGDPPGIWPPDEKGERSYATVDWRTPTRTLGVEHDAAQFDRLGVNVTQAGKDRGLREWWTSTWAVAMQPGVVALGVDEHGLAGAWSKSYGGAPGTGFIYINRTSWSAETLPQLQAVAEMRPLR